jgi:hypothetical protein
MRSTLLSFERRATYLAAVALLGTTFLAACDDSRPTEPVHTAAAPSKPSDARYISTGTLMEGSRHQLEADRRRGVPDQRRPWQDPVGHA